MSPSVNDDAPAPESLRVSRRERANRTRRRIIEAAHASFVARGYHATTMTAVAEQAGVAVQTVYFVFGTKAALLRDVIAASVWGMTSSGEFEVDPRRADWYQSALAAGSADQAVRRFVHGALEILVRAAGIWQVARVAAQTDADVAHIVAQAERYQQEQWAEFTTALASRGFLRPEIELDRAGDVLATIVGPQVYLAFTDMHGWSDAEVEAWMSDATARLLIADG